MTTSKKLKPIVFVFELNWGGGNREEYMIFLDIILLYSFMRKIHIKKCNYIAAKLIGMRKTYEYSVVIKFPYNC
jgi:hypothetical protein